MNKLSVDEIELTDGQNGISPQELIAILGYGSFIGWFFICAFNLIPTCIRSDSSTDFFPLFVILYFAGLSFITCVNAFLNIRIINRYERLIFPAASIISVLLPLYAALQTLEAVPTIPFVIFFLGALSGCATASFYYLWDSICLRLELRNHLRYLCTSLAIGCVLFLLTYALFSNVGHAIFVLILVILSIGTCFYLLRRTVPINDAFFKPQDNENHQHKGPIQGEKPAAAKLNPKIRILFIIFGAAFGSAWMILILKQPISPAPVFVMIAIAMLFLIILFRKDSVAHDRYVSMLMRVSIVILGICFLAIPVTQQAISSVALCLLCAFWQVFWAIDSALLLRHTEKHAFKLLKHIAMGQFSSYTGFLFGLLLVKILSSLFGLNETLSILSPIITALCLISGMALYPYYKNVAPNSYAIRGTQQAKSSPTKLDKTQQCEHLSRRYGLSPREHEILLLLANGQGNREISEELVLSPHTVKSHIYNIYQKLNVHSRQELMQSLEDASVTGSSSGSID